jgi:hypothetical protein
MWRTSVNGRFRRPVRISRPLAVHWATDAGEANKSPEALKIPKLPIIAIFFDRNDSTTAWICCKFRQSIFNLLVSRSVPRPIDWKDPRLLSNKLGCALWSVGEHPQLLEWSDIKLFNEAEKNEVCHRNDWVS